MTNGVALQEYAATYWLGEGGGHRGDRSGKHPPGVLDTAGHSDPDRCMDLIERAALGLPPPYRPLAGRPVYQIRAGESIVFVAERELVGPLRELVMTALVPGRAEADPGGIALTQEQDDRDSRPPRGGPVPVEPGHG